MSWLSRPARILGPALLWVAFAVCSPAPGVARDVHLVAIGNDVGSPDEVELRYAERDALGFARVLQQLGGVPATSTVVALGEDAAGVRRALADTSRRIGASVRGGEQDTVLVVYYSGHADAAGLHLGSSTLSYAELERIVAETPAQARVLILDSCRSGAATRKKGAIAPAPEFEIRLQRPEGVTGLAIVTSSAEGEDSHESDRLRASFFSHHLVTGLRGAADRSGDGRVTLHEAYDYAYRQTLRSSGRTARLQHPTYRYELEGRGELELTRVADGDRGGARLRLPGPDLYLIFENDEDGDVVAELMVDGESARISVPPGRYFLQRRARDHYVEYRVQATRGETVDVRRVAGRPIAYARLVRKGGGRAAAHGLYLLGGVRGEVLPGEGAVAQAILGYSVDLAWFSVGARGRFGLGSMTAVDGVAESNHYEGALGLTLQRYFDVSSLALSVGLTAEATYHRQTFETPGRAEARNSWGFAFGGLVTAELELWPALALRLEGGPLTHVLQRGVTEAGAVVREDVESVFSWWSALGVVWRL